MVVPVQCMGNPLQSVQVVLGNGHSEMPDRNISHQKMIEKKTNGRRRKGRKRRGRDNKLMKKMESNVVRGNTQSLNCITNSNWSCICKEMMNIILRKKGQLDCGGVVLKNVCKLNHGQASNRLGRRQRKSESVLNCPIGNVHIPMRV
jgi:hypothetical protein